MTQLGRPRQFDVDEVLDIAMEVFWTHGYEGTSVADLMAATGLQKGSLYKAFGDKRSLFLRSLQRYFELASEKAESILGEHAAPRKALEGWLKHALSNCGDGGEHRGCFAINVIVEMAPHDDEVAATLADHFDAIKRRIAHQIKAGQASGEFRTDMDAKTLAAAFWSAAAGLLTTGRGVLSAREGNRTARAILALLDAPTT